MDNGKVNGSNVAAQVHAAGTQPPRAAEAATNRFVRALRESPNTATTDSQRAGGMAALHATPASELTHEAALENRQYAYRGLGGLPAGPVMDAITRDAGTNQPAELSRTHIEPDSVAIPGAVWSPLAIAAQSRSMFAAQSAPGGELAQMLERMCSGLYVGEKSVASQRVLMALDHVLPGAAAEIVREGVHLAIRLHARNEHSYLAMSAQREALVRALNGDGDRRVDVTVVRGNGEKSPGDHHG